MNRIRAPPNLPELVWSTFAKARSDGELHYFPTQVTVLNLPSTSVPFQLRFSPSLANKPKSGPPPSNTSPSQSQKDSSSNNNSSKPFDPFANPPLTLFLTDVGPSHFLVLNKFAVVPEHFILATKEFKPQTHVLEEDDLEATRACIEVFEEARSAAEASSAQASSGSASKKGKEAVRGYEQDDEAGVADDNSSSGESTPRNIHENPSTGDAASRHGEEGLFAFFNCGEHSGASQPHRHIQLLPIATMRSDLDGHNPWSILADTIKPQTLPFLTFSEPISLDMSPSDLHGAYIRLYRLACKAVAEQANGGGTADVTTEEDVSSEGEVKISYNMAMTRDTLVICPRLSEGSRITNASGHDVGSLALNGTLLAGTALVKNEAEWEALRNDPAGLLEILKKIGIPTEETK